MAKYQCPMCKYIYSEEDGEPSENIAPDTSWQDVPSSFKCPYCRVKKEHFESVS